MFRGNYISNLFLFLALSGIVVAEMSEFKVHKMGSKGNKQGQTSLVDVDKDGDLDFISGSRNSEVRWWEYRSADDWKLHPISGDVSTDVGGVALDVDGDGWVDQVSGGSWYKNPGENWENQWKRTEFGGSKAHDQRIGDLNGDGKMDVITLTDNHFDWYDTSPEGEWEKHTIGDGIHSGLAIGDIDGDGDLDVVRGVDWFENENGEGTKWKKHSMNTKVADDGKWSGETAAELGDLDGDGDLDLAHSGHDGNGVAWMENTDGKGDFLEHFLFDQGDKMHSLQLADFNNDGKLDIYAGDTDLGKSQYIWENLGNKEFSRQKIATGPGHETRTGDVDGDGDIDLCSKPWNGGDHFYYQNMYVENGGNPTTMLHNKNKSNFNDRKKLKEYQLDGSQNTAWEHGNGKIEISLEN